MGHRRGAEHSPRELLAKLPQTPCSPQGRGDPGSSLGAGLHLASCMRVVCLGAGFGDLCIVLGVRTWMPSPCLGQGHGTLARCFGAHHWDPVTLLRVRTQGCSHGVGMWGTLHQGRGWTWRCLRGAGGQDKGTLAWHLVSCGAPCTVLGMGLGCRSFASGDLGTQLLGSVWQDLCIRVRIWEPLQRGQDLGTAAPLGAQQLEAGGGGGRLCLSGPSLQGFIHRGPGAPHIAPCSRWASVGGLQAGAQQFQVRCGAGAILTPP